MPRALTSQLLIVLVGGLNPTMTIGSQRNMNSSHFMGIRASNQVIDVIVSLFIYFSWVDHGPEKSLNDMFCLDCASTAKTSFSLLSLENWK